MARSLRLYIRQSDIEKGWERSPYKCPIAKALRREYPDAFWVSVGSYQAFVISEGGCQDFLLLGKALEFRRRFDNQAEVWATKVSLRKILARS